jgi:hypothetical protein
MCEQPAYCGILCSTCPIHLATMETDLEVQVRKRREIVRLCKEQYGMAYELSDISDCDGCIAESGRLFSGCKDCSIRQCTMKKLIKNCAYCSEYICENLANFFLKDPEAKIRLEEVKNQIS